MALYLGNNKVSLRSVLDIPKFDYGFDKDGKLVWANTKIKLTKKAGSRSFIRTNYDDNTNTVVKIIHSFNKAPEQINERYTLIHNGASYQSPSAFYYNWWCSSIKTDGSKNYASWFQVGTSGGAQSYNINLVPGHIYEVVMSGTTSVHQKLTDLTTGEVIQEYNNTWSFDGRSIEKLMIFAYNPNHTEDYSIHQVKIIEDNKIISHFVPVPQGLQIGSLTVPSNGMFDIVEQKFYGNAGTGTFLYGRDE